MGGSLTAPRDAGACDDVPSSPHAGWLPLWRAAAYGHTATAEALLVAGASVNLQDNDGAGAPALELISARAPAPSLSWKLTLPPATSSASAVAVRPYAAAYHREHGTPVAGPSLSSKLIVNSR